MSQIGISPELKKKIFDIEYICLTKGNNFLSKEEKELIGGEKSKIHNYLALCQKNLPFAQFNNVRGDFNEDFFEHFEEIASWFSSRSSKLSVALIPSNNSVSLINELINKGFVLSGYVCYWYKQLDGESFSSFNKNNILKVTDDLADIFADTVAKGFQFDPQASSYNVFYNIFKIGCRFPFNNDFLYKREEKFIGTGSVIFEEDFAFLAVGSVLPDYRGKQIQQELINYRLDYAKSKGMKHAIVTTGLDTTSGRNMQRLGFQLAFTAEFFTYNPTKDKKK